MVKPRNSILANVAKKDPARFRTRTVKSEKEKELIRARAKAKTRKLEDK